MMKGRERKGEPISVPGSGRQVVCALLVSTPNTWKPGMVAQAYNPSIARWRQKELTWATSVNSRPA